MNYSVWPLQAKPKIWYDNWKSSHLVAILVSSWTSVLHNTTYVPSFIHPSKLSPPLINPPPPTHTHIFALPLDCQSTADRRAKENWDVATLTGSLYWLVPFHHPSQRPCWPKNAHAHTHSLQQEGPRPGKLIKLPEWTSEAHKAKVVERESTFCFCQHWGWAWDHKQDGQTDTAVMHAAIRFLFSCCLFLLKLFTAVSDISNLLHASIIGLKVYLNIMWTGHIFQHEMWSARVYSVHTAAHQTGHLAKELFFSISQMF